jgi:hypothetical protein
MIKNPYSYEDRLNECPCNKCLCIPVCRSRWFQTMVRNCELVQDYLYNDPECGKNPYNGDDYYDRMQITRMILFRSEYR